jgi:Rnl2 family RNA ligase
VVSATGFLPYPKIAERLDADEAAQRALSRVPWVVTEKIHGANLALVSDGSQLRAAKRKALLLPGEEFFGWEEVVARVADAIGALARALLAEDAARTTVIVYGELFGGGYPHPDVPPVVGVAPVQTGVWYAPGIEWRAFDVAVARGDDVVMLDWEQAESRLAGAGVPYLEPLLVGKMHEAQGFALGFETRIPAALGLPRIEGNRAEGVVLKPARAVVVDGEAVAPRLKRKLDEFAEDERFHGAQKWSHATTRAGTTGAAATLLPALLARVNEPRLDAARSKIGRIRRDDAARRAELSALIVDEVVDEVAASHKSAWGRASPVERERLRVQLAAAVAQLIERRWR